MYTMRIPALTLITSLCFIGNSTESENSSNVQELLTNSAYETMDSVGHTHQSQGNALNEPTAHVHVYEDV